VNNHYTHFQFQALRDAVNLAPRIGKPFPFQEPLPLEKLSTNRTNYNSEMNKSVVNTAEYRSLDPTLTEPLDEAREQIVNVVSLLMREQHFSAFTRKQSNVISAWGTEVMDILMPIQDDFN
jgi:hypothetical protein